MAIMDAPMCPVGCRDGGNSLKGNGTRPRVAVGVEVIVSLVDIRKVNPILKVCGGTPGGGGR